VHSRFIYLNRSRQAFNNNKVIACFILSAALLLTVFLSNKVVADTLPPLLPKTVKTAQFNVELQTELLAMQQTVVQFQQKKTIIPQWRITNNAH
jgi:hypothetical protein